MSKSLLIRLASLTFSTYLLSIVSPLSIYAANKNSPFDLLQETSEVYEQARAAFYRGGSAALKNEIPSRFFSAADIDFIVQHARASKALPTMHVTEDNKLLIKINEGKGLNEKITIEILDAEKNLYAINGKNFSPNPTGVESNFNAIMTLVGSPTKSSKSLWDQIVPDAQASGMSTSTLVLGGVAVAASAAAIYLYAKTKSGEKFFNKLKRHHNKVVDKVLPAPLRPSHK